MTALCAFRGRVCGSIISGGQSASTFLCEHPAHRTTTDAQCRVCPDFAAKVEGQAAPRAAPISIYRPSPPEPIFYLPTGKNRSDHRSIDPTGLYRGGAVFLTLGGPSLKSTPLEKLAARGICIASYNNNPAALPAPIRPHIWFHTDKVSKFHDSIWRDSSVLKFSCTRDWRAERGRKRHGFPWKNVQRRKADGSGFEPLGTLAVDLPGVVGYTRNSTFRPEYWLTEGTINRGNDKRSAERNGYPHVINSMFTAIRLLYILGFSTVYLVGADFRMDHAQPYAFEQKKSSGGVNANNEAFRKLDGMFAVLQPYLLAGGMTIYNTTEGSGLRAFPYLPFVEAVESVAGEFEQTLDAKGWYDD